MRSALPVEHAEPPRRIESTHVTGVEPAVLEGAGGPVGVVEVASHHRRPAHQDLALPPRRKGAAAGVGNPDLRSEERAPHAPDLVGSRLGIAGGAGRHLGAGLGEPVAGQHGKPELARALQEQGRRGRATEQDPAQGGGSRPPCADIEQAAEHGGNQRDVGDPVVDGRAHPLRIEALVDQNGGSEQHVAHQNGEAPDVEERKTGEPPIIATELEVQRRGEGARLEVSVGQADPLGRCTGPGGEEHREDRPEIDALGERRGVAPIR